MLTLLESTVSSKLQDLPEEDRLEKHRLILRDKRDTGTITIIKLLLMKLEAI